MRPLCIAALYVILPVSLFFSCATTLRTLPQPPQEAVPALPETIAPPRENPMPPAAESPRSVPETPQVPEVPEIPPLPERIIGSGQTSSQNMTSFLLDSNPGADPGFVESLAAYYVAEAQQEGVNHDIAFAQMCLETSFLRFGGLVTPDMNNFCGLGSIGPGQTGEHFPSPQLGVRAHIQHLKAYATDEPLNQELVDPRYRWVRYGSAPTIQGLSGTWAADTNYSAKIEKILLRLYGSAFSGPRS
jgi:hypothetical protein